jgi:hypothetical protein
MLALPSPLKPLSQFGASKLPRTSTTLFLETEEITKWQQQQT